MKLILEPNWSDVSREIQALLRKYEVELTREATEAVEHYISHDEYEMALEGLCIELMKLESFNISKDREVCKALSRQLGLDRSSVFDSEFWEKLNQGPLSPSSG